MNKIPDFFISMVTKDFIISMKATKIQYFRLYFVSESMILNKNIYRPLSILIMVGLFFLSGCSKESERNDIPDVAVNFSLNPNSTEYIELNGVNGWVYLTGGYKGILIYRKSLNEFMAYERACPFDWEVTGARIEVESSGLTVECPICHSKYIMIDGTPYEGPTHFILKQYMTNYDGNLLYISN